jgi:hypothetical protein
MFFIAAFGSRWHIYPLITACFIIGGNFIFYENGVVGTLRNASAAIDAGFRINVIGGPFFHRFPGHNAFHGTYFNTTGVIHAERGDYMGHRKIPPKLA